MKSPKRIAAILLAGFLAFAPPGTLIFLFVLLMGLVGRRWAVSLAALCLCAGAGFLLLRRRRRGRPGADDSVKLEEH
jgi:membrane protein implicated in regulation of membrane protease activity